MPYSKYRRGSRTRRYGYGRRSYASRLRKTRSIGRSRVPRNRRYSNRRVASTSTSCVPRFTKFVYHDVNFTAALNGANFYKGLRVFRGNSLYDPDFTGVGITAMYLSKLVGSGKFYNYYTVMSSKITVYATVTNTAAGTVSDIPKVRMAVFPSHLSAPIIPTIAEIDVQPGCKKLNISGDTSRRWKLTSYQTSKHNLIPGSPTDIEWYGTESTNPNRQWYWYLYIDGSDMAKDVTVNFDIYIKYYTRLVDRATVTLS